MASPCEVAVVATETAARAAAAAAEAEVLRIERKYSRYRDDSAVTAINRAAGATAVEIDDETAQLLHTADLLYGASHGLFDITSGVLRRAWNFTDQRVPTEHELASVLPLINWAAVEREDNRVRLPQRGMELDFGGFGKEYAVDRATQAVQQCGIDAGYVNLGGDIRVLGSRPDATPWVFGIRHPRNDADVIATIPVTAGALATSGDYERYFESDGKRYCHVLNPRTGRPVTYWRSVSVLAPNAVLAGSFCTIAMLFEANGLQLLQESGLPFLAVDAAGRIWHDYMDAHQTNSRTT
jgi:thiamine biosynthesis lipoprotein